jgi:hypothetical protein
VNFQLQRRTRSSGGTWGSYALLASPAANATSHSDTGLAEGTTYRHRRHLPRPASSDGRRPSLLHATPAAATVPETVPSSGGTPG